MKLRVVGWTYSDDMRFEEGEGSFAAHEAIVKDVREHGYDFTGWHHQEADRGAPVLNDGRIYRYSRRGWGGLMADAFDDNNDTYSYARYAFSFGEHGDSVKMPPDSRDMGNIIHDLAQQLLSEQERRALYEEAYTARVPHPELGETEIYTLTPEEAGSVSCFDTVRQLPNCIMNRLFDQDLSESFVLDGYECRMSSDRITLPMTSSLTYIGPGDTVVLGGVSYRVRDVDRRRDVDEDIRLRVMYTSNEGYDEALRIYNNAPTLVDIFI